MLGVGGSEKHVNITGSIPSDVRCMENFLLQKALSKIALTRIRQGQQKENDDSCFEGDTNTACQTSRAGKAHSLTVSIHRVFQTGLSALRFQLELPEHCPSMSISMGTGISLMLIHQIFFMLPALLTVAHGLLSFPMRSINMEALRISTRSTILRSDPKNPSTFSKIIAGNSMLRDSQIVDGQPSVHLLYSALPYYTPKL